MRSARKFVKYCWSGSKKVHKESSKSRLWLFFDMLIFGFKYESTTIKYEKLKYYDLSKEERLELHPQLMKSKENVLYHYKLLKFLSKYATLKYEHPKRITKRTEEYTKMFKMGKNCSVRYNCWIMTTHDRIGEFHVGHKIAFGRNTEIDFTGGLSIGNGVDLAERSIILTHGHDIYGLKNDKDLIEPTTRAYATPLIIEDNVFIGAQSIIMPGVTRIGENAVISAGSVVTEEVPKNAIVAGNPAKVVGKLPRVYYRYNKK